MRRRKYDDRCAQLSLAPPPGAAAPRRPLNHLLRLHKSPPRVGGSGLRMIPCNAIAAAEGVEANSQSVGMP